MLAHLVYFGLITSTIYELLPSALYVFCLTANGGVGLPDAVAGVIRKLALNVKGPLSLHDLPCVSHAESVGRAKIKP